MTKKTKKVEVEEPQVQDVVETPQVVKQPKPKYEFSEFYQRFKK